MLQHNFQSTSNRSDWRMPFTLDASRVLGPNPWGPNDVVELNISPDHASWDDYGHRRYDAPPLDERVGSSAAFSTRSDTGDGIVTLSEPATISILVPHWVIGGLGIGTVSVGIHYLRLVGGRAIARETLLAGALPIVRVA